MVERKSKMAEIVCSFFHGHGRMSNHLTKRTLSKKPRRDHGQRDQKHLSTKQITKDIKIHNVKKLRGEIIT